MSSHSKLFRSALVAVLLVAVVGASGCRWFRKGNDAYAQSPESRPLEVPPDLDRPNTDGAMKMPPAGGSVSRSTMAAPAAATSGASGFTVAGERDAVFERVGTALAAMDGVSVVSRAQLLGTFDIDYKGSKFLVRVSKVDAGAYVSAIDPRGLPATGEAAASLVSGLKSALGN